MTMNWNRSKKYGVTLVEIIAVITIIGITAAISYPALIRYYYNQQINGCALEIVSLLTTARGLSVSSGGGNIYGVVFKKSGDYSIYSFEQGKKIDASNYVSLGKVYRPGEESKLSSNIEITNFAKNKCDVFFIIYRDDGVPTADGINFPLPSSNAQIELVSSGVIDPLNVKVSKSTGHADIE
ncbi:MAG: prepilin-type N-terminal cleavage/methylation domain-containing protein [Candidatus Wallbacteria bacterium]